MGARNKNSSLGTGPGYQCPGLSLWAKLAGQLSSFLRYYAVPFAQLGTSFADRLTRGSLPEKARAKPFDSKTCDFATLTLFLIQ